MADKTDFLLPPGRMVMGDLYKPSDKDADGNPLLIKNGPNAGQPRVNYFIGVAIPKGAERHWAETEWGAKIWAVGHREFPQAAQSRQFAWKVVDGDSTEANTKGQRPCDSEGFKGHWVLRFGSGFAPKIYNSNGSQQILEEGAVKRGYYVQVFGNVSGNNSTQKPGVYLNYSLVALAAYGPEITSGPDAAAVGFGQAPLPAGASTTPPAGAFNPAPAVPMPPGAPVPPPAAPAAPAAPAVPVPPPAAPAAPVAPAATVPAPAAPVAPVPTVPHAAILNPAPPVRVMLPAAGGATYESFIASGWTDALLVQHGMMAP